jgi:hypothetical protein
VDGEEDEDHSSGHLSHGVWRGERRLAPLLQLQRSDGASEERAMLDERLK